jgi:hypothetical protein
MRLLGDSQKSPKSYLMSVQCLVGRGNFVCVCVVGELGWIRRSGGFHVCVLSFVLELVSLISMDCVHWRATMPSKHVENLVHEKLLRCDVQ